MAIASVKITCSCCGKLFEHRKTCRNRTEANSYEAWAADNIDTCPSCYAEIKAASARKRMEEELADVFAAHPLPVITGTEKQIAYADKLRARHLAAWPEDLRNYWFCHTATREDVDSEWAADYAEEHGLTLDAALDECVILGARMFDQTHKATALIATTGSASALIDALR